MITATTQASSSTSTSQVTTTTSDTVGKLLFSNFYNHDPSASFSDSTAGRARGVYTARAFQAGRDASELALT